VTGRFRHHVACPQRKAAHDGTSGTKRTSAAATPVISSRKGTNAGTCRCRAEMIEVSIPEEEQPYAVHASAT